MREPLPSLWSFLCQDWLCLTHHETVCWWQTVSRAQSPKAVALRSTLLYHAGREETDALLHHLVQHTLRPHALIAAIEAMVEEGSLSRAQANGWEDAVLQQTDHLGAWKDEPAGRRTQNSA